MKQMTLDLDESQQRPIIMLGNGLDALLDTGALIPVWVGEESVLTRGLKAQLVKRTVPFFGFGGKTYGNLYKVTIQVGELLYPNMHIIACHEWNASFHMILRATMFSNLIYEIDEYNHKFNVTVPDSESSIRHLKIVDKNGKIYVLCSSEENT